MKGSKDFAKQSTNKCQKLLSKIIPVTQSGRFSQSLGKCFSSSFHMSQLKRNTPAVMSLYGHVPCLPKKHRPYCYYCSSSRTCINGYTGDWRLVMCLPIAAYQGLLRTAPSVFAALLPVGNVLSPSPSQYRRNFNVLLNA